MLPARYPTGGDRPRGRQRTHTERRSSGAPIMDAPLIVGSNHTGRRNSVPRPHSTFVHHQVPEDVGAHREPGHIAGIRATGNREW